MFFTSDMKRYHQSKSSKGDIQNTMDIRRAHQAQDGLAHRTQNTRAAKQRECGQSEQIGKVAARAHQVQGGSETISPNNRGVLNRDAHGHAKKTWQKPWRIAKC